LVVVRRGEISKGAGSRQRSEVAGSLHQQLKRNNDQLISGTVDSLVRVECSSRWDEGNSGRQLVAMEGRRTEG
jgi:hypothetical protein